MITMNHAVALMNTSPEYVNRLMRYNLCDDCKSEPKRMCNICDPKVMMMVSLAHSLPLDGVICIEN